MALQKNLQEAAGDVEKTLLQITTVLGKFANKLTEDTENAGKAGVGIILSNNQLANIEAKDLGEQVIGDALRDTRKAMAHKQDNLQSDSVSQKLPTFKAS